MALRRRRIKEIIKNKSGLLKLAVVHENVSVAWNDIGCFRSGFSHFRKPCEAGRELALLVVSRRVPVSRSKPMVQSRTAFLIFP